MKGWVGSVVLLVLALVISGCASQPMSPGNIPSVPGFWMGLVQGMIAPFALIASIFMDDVRIYAFPNGGGWYDFGFIMGLGIVWGGGSRTV